MRVPPHIWQSIWDFKNIINFPVRVQVDLITIYTEIVIYLKKKKTHKEFTFAYFYPTVERLAEFPWNRSVFSCKEEHRHWIGKMKD